MHKPEKFIVRGDTLQIGPTSLQVGSVEWVGWLAQHSKFSFQGENGHFMAQRETRRSQAYWYAYRRRAGKLFKQYLGKAEELTVERLEAASITLAGQNLFEQYAHQPAGGPPSGVESRIDTTLLPMTKVNPPALPLHLLARPRLTAQINKPLTLVSASSGFGKSTLLNDWKRTCGIPVAWLSLDEADNHPVRFWCSVVTALQILRPGFGEELLGYLRAAPPVHLPEVVSRLTNDILASLGGIPRFGLVLDDFQVIRRPELTASIQAWLEQLPPNMQLIILGHSQPALSLGNLRARGSLTELDANDLRFSLEEGIRYLQQYPQEPPLAYTDLEKLVKHTEGWAAGLTLTAVALGKHEDRRQFIDTFSGAHIYLREYFMETVLKDLDPDVQAFLLKTAILKHLTGSLCDAVMGQPGGEAMLARLWQENLFLTRLEEQGWYRYHDLFAEMLLSQLHARFPGEVPQLHQRAAQWYRERDAPADAVSHLLAVDAWEDAAALIETMALRELESYGEDSRLLRWLQDLPEGVVQQHKTLLFVYLRLAEVALPKQKIKRFIERIEANLARKTAFQPTQEARDVLVEIRRIRRVWKNGDYFTPPARDDNDNDAKWEVLNGLHLLSPGNRPEPDLWEEQVYGLLHKAQAQHNLFVVLMAGGVLARQTFLRGQLRRSEKIARQVLDQALLQRGKLPEPASIALSVLSQVHLERNELALAQRYLTQAQNVDPNPTSTNMVVQNGILWVWLQAAQGKFDEALVDMHAIRELHTRRPSGMWTDQDLLAQEALLCLRQGAAAAAEELIDQSESMGEHDLSQLARAKILLQKNRAGAAEQQLTRLISRNPSHIDFEPLMDARVQLALALFAQHKHHQALQTITEAVRCAAPERIFRPFLESGVQGDGACAALLALALKTERLTGDAQAFLTEALGFLGRPGSYSPAEMEAFSTSASISQREQDVLSLLSNGYSNGAMAQELCISESTVKTHLSNIYTKLGVNSRMQALKRGKELKLI